MNTNEPKPYDEAESWPMPAPFNWHESVYEEAERRVQEVMRQPLEKEALSASSPNGRTE